MKKWTGLIFMWVLLFVGVAVAGDYNYQNPPGWNDDLCFTHQSWDFLSDDKSLIPDAPGQTIVNPFGTPQLVETKHLESVSMFWQWNDEGVYAMLATRIKFGDSFRGAWGGMYRGGIGVKVPGKPASEAPGQIKQAWVQYLIYQKSSVTKDEMVSHFYSDKASTDGGHFVGHSVGTMVSREVEFYCKLLNKDDEVIEDHTAWRVTELWNLSESQGTDYFYLESVDGKCLFPSLDIDTRFVPLPAVPVATPGHNTYFENPIDVSLSCDTDGASIYYTLDGSEPGVSSSLYSTPISISESTTVKAVAIKDDLKGSVMTAAYHHGSQKAAAPTVFPETGNFGDFLSATASTAEDGAVIRFTLDESEPTLASPVYSSAIEVRETKTLKVRVYKDGLLPSDVVTTRYTRSDTIAEPLFNPGNGSPFSGSINLSLATDLMDGVIRYTMDGTTPTGTSLVYTSPITLDATATVQAFVTCGSRQSGVAEKEYIRKAQMPSAAPSTGTVFTEASLSVALTSPEPGAAIRFTIDGTEPDGASALYSDAIEVTGTTTIKAKAFLSGCQASDTLEAIYKRGDVGPSPGPAPPSNYTYNGYKSPPGWESKPGFSHQSWDFKYIGVNSEGNAYGDVMPYGADAKQGSIPNPQNSFGTPMLYTGATPGDMSGWSANAMGYDTLASDKTVFHGFYGGMGAYWLAFDVPVEGSIAVGHTRRAWVQYIVYATNNTSGVMDSRFYTAKELDDASRVADAMRESRDIVDLGKAGGTGHYFRVTEVWRLPAQKVFYRLEGVGGITMIDSVDIDTITEESLTGSIAFLPVSGSTFTSSVAVSISCAEAPSGAKIRYTLDGTEPSSGSPVYTSPISLSNTTTVTCRVFQDGVAISGVVSSVYLKQSRVSTPSFTPFSPASFVNTLAVSLVCSTPGSTMRYTLDGSTPDEGSALYENPLSLSKTTTVKAVAFKEGMASSKVASGTFTRKIGAVNPPSGGTMGKTGVVRIAFAQEMNRSSVEGAFKMTLKGSGEAVSGSFSWDGNTLIFKPDAPLTVGQGYTVTLGKDAQDAQGHALGAAYTFSFGVVANPMITCPTEADTYLLFSGMGGGGGYPHGAPSGEKIMKVAAAFVDSRGLMRFDLSPLVYTDDNGEKKAYRGGDIIKAEWVYTMKGATFSDSGMKLGPPSAAGTPMNGFLHLLSNKNYEYTEAGNADALPAPTEPLAPWTEDTVGAGYVWQKTKPGYVASAPMISVTHTTGIHSTCRVDVTPYVKGWLDGRWPNNGMEIKDEDDKSVPNSDIGDGYNWFIASREDPNFGPKLEVTVKGERGLHFSSATVAGSAVTLAEQIKATLGEAFSVATDAGAGSQVSWKLKDPKGSPLKTATLAGNVPFEYAPGQTLAGVYTLTAQAGGDAIAMEIGVRAAGDSAAEDAARENHPLYLSPDTPESVKTRVRAVCEAVSLALGQASSGVEGKKGPIARVTLKESGTATHVGGTGSSTGSHVMILCLASGTDGFDFEGEAGCSISLAKGASSWNAPLFVVAVRSDLEVPGGASGIFEFMVQKEDGTPAEDVISAGLTLTLACDGNLVDMAGFSSGKYHIFYAETPAGLLASMGGTEPQRVPSEDIVSCDEGSVRFNVNHLTAFGVGANKADYSAVKDAANDPKTMEGCFIQSLGAY